MSEQLDLFYEIESDFLNYIDCFVDDEEDTEFLQLIELKKEHSLKVSELAGQIAQAEKFNDKTTLLCKVAGLMHDIGRFEQLNLFGTLDDLKSIDHGDLGYDVLSNTGFLEHFSTPEQLALLFAVKNHNKRYVTQFPDDITEKITKTVRDADKLDVYRVMQTNLENANNGNRKAVLLELDENGEISEEVMQQFENHEIVNKKLLKTATDFLVMQLSWIFDVNYQSTFNLIAQSDGYRYLMSCLSNSNIYDKVEDIVSKYIYPKQ